MTLADAGTLAGQRLHGETGLDPDRAALLTARALDGCDDGELFLEHRCEETLVLADGRITDASFRTSLGFGLRALAGAAVGFVHGTVLDHAVLARAADSLAAVRQGYSGTMTLPPSAPSQRLYAPLDPTAAPGYRDKLAMLAAIDSRMRRDPRVVQVTATLTGECQTVRILRAAGIAVADVRPLVRLTVVVETCDGNRVESGRELAGGRYGYEPLLRDEAWQRVADTALRRALAKLEARPAPAGEMPVVIGPGWTGVLLHEAVGHGLEGDFLRKRTSVFTRLRGERVAAPGVTVVDDGTIADRRGSLTVDDEGTPTQRTVLIDNGILVGAMQDRLNARLTGTVSTGNGRRESARFAPMPRMTNTIMLGGDTDPAEIIAAAGSGVYIAMMSGGTVEESTGDFNFTATEAYRIENGRLGAPLRDVMLIGKGHEVLRRVRLIGNDFALDGGAGTCGKAGGMGGQSVPIGVGQPTILLDSMLVGGTG